jgi:hypothetical protein
LFRHSADRSTNIKRDTVVLEVEHNGKPIDLTFHTESFPNGFVEPMPTVGTIFTDKQYIYIKQENIKQTWSDLPVLKIKIKNIQCVTVGEDLLVTIMLNNKSTLPLRFFNQSTLYRFCDGLDSSIYVDDKLVCIRQYDGSPTEFGLFYATGCFHREQTTLKDLTKSLKYSKEEMDKLLKRPPPKSNESASKYECFVDYHENKARFRRYQQKTHSSQATVDEFPLAADSIVSIVGQQTLEISGAGQADVLLSFSTNYSMRLAYQEMQDAVTQITSDSANVSFRKSIIGMPYEHAADKEVVVIYADGEIERPNIDEFMQSCEQMGLSYEKMKMEHKTQVEAGDVPNGHDDEKKEEDVEDMKEEHKVQTFEDVEEDEGSDQSQEDKENDHHDVMDLSSTTASVSLTSGVKRQLESSTIVKSAKRHCSCKPASPCPPPSTISSFDYDTRISLLCFFAKRELINLKLTRHI